MPTDLFPSVGFMSNEFKAKEEAQLVAKYRQDFFLQQREREGTLGEQAKAALEKRRQTYLTANEDLSNLRNHYRNILRKKLQNKVNKQHESLYGDAADEQDEKPSNPKNFLRRSLPRSSLQDFDNQFQVSSSYQIQEILGVIARKDGHMHQEEMDEFYKLMTSPGNLEVVSEHLRQGNSLSFLKLKKLLIPDYETVKKKEEFVPKTLNKSPPRRRRTQETRFKKITKRLGKYEEFYKNEKKIENQDARFAKKPNYPRLDMLQKNQFKRFQPDPDEEKDDIMHERRLRQIELDQVRTFDMFQRSRIYQEKTKHLLNENHSSTENHWNKRIYAQTMLPEISKSSSSSSPEQYQSLQQQPIMKMIQHKIDEKPSIQQGLEKVDEEKSVLSKSIAVMSDKEAETLSTITDEKLDVWIHDYHKRESRLDDLGEDTLSVRSLNGEMQATSPVVLRMKSPAPQRAYSSIKRDPPKQKEIVLEPLSLVSLEKTNPIKEAKAASVMWRNPVKLGWLT